MDTLSQIKSAAGSDAEYSKITEWAATNIPQNEVNYLSIT